MSLQLQHFVEGFTEKCAQYGFTSQEQVQRLLKAAADTALEAVEEVYKKQGKKTSTTVQRHPQAGQGVYSYEEGRAEQYPIRT